LKYLNPKGQFPTPRQIQAKLASIHCTYFSWDLI